MYQDQGEENVGMQVGDGVTPFQLFSFSKLLCLIVNWLLSPEMLGKLPTEKTRVTPKKGYHETLPFPFCYLETLAQLMDHAFGLGINLLQGCSHWNSIYMD